MYSYPDNQYRLQTDASVAGVGAVLSVVRDGVEKPTAFFSRQLTAAEKNYTASELECLGIITAVSHFEVYLTGRNFTLVTDHQALQGLRTSRHLNRRLTRWAMFLQDYDFDLQYRPGSQNGNADGLSRQCWSGRRQEDRPEERNVTVDSNHLRRGKCGRPVEPVGSGPSHKH